MYLHLLIKVSKQFFTSALVLYNLLCGCWPFYPWVPACAKSCPLLRALCMLEQLPLYQEPAQTQRHHLAQIGTRGQKCQLWCRSFIPLSPVGGGCPHPDWKSTVHPAAYRRVLCPALGALGACSRGSGGLCGCSTFRLQVPACTKGHCSAGLYAMHAPYKRWRAWARKKGMTCKVSKLKKQRSTPGCVTQSHYSKLLWDTDALPGISITYLS